MRYLFSLMEDRKQLHLVKYNKSLQKILNINIINYRVLSGKYTIYENEKINDNFGDILYKVEYLNGKRNGKGKEYNKKGELIFEGEYLNGKKSKRKEYLNGKLIFEGEYLNGKKNGEYKEFISNLFCKLLLYLIILYVFFISMKEKTILAI